MGALDGIRVLDLSTVVMGPYATQILGDWGADVIKIEEGGTDTSRHMGPGPAPYLSGVSMNLLRNKRSISVDLKTEAGLGIARAIAAEVDVVVTNLRPGPLARLGLSDDDLRPTNPGLIFCHAQGWSIESGKSDRPAYDDVIQTAAGLPFLQEAVTGEPALIPTIMADKVCGLTIANAVLAALVARGRTGVGQRVEVPMFDTALAFVLVEHLAAATTPGGKAGYPRILTPNRRAQRTLDGWIVILPYTNAHWRTMCASVDRLDLVDDPRFATPAARIMNSGPLYGALGEFLATRPTSYWVELCDAEGVPCEVAHSINDIVNDPALHMGVIVDDEHPVGGPYRRIASPVRFEGTPSASSVRHAPMPGGDTDEILRGLGHDDASIVALRSSGAVA